MNLLILKYSEDDLSHNNCFEFHLTENFSAFASMQKPLKGLWHKMHLKLVHYAMRPELKPEKPKILSLGGL